MGSPENSHRTILSSLISFFFQLRFRLNCTFSLVENRLSLSFQLTSGPIRVHMRHDSASGFFSISPKR